MISAEYGVAEVSDVGIETKGAQLEECWLGTSSRLIRKTIGGGAR